MNGEYYYTRVSTILLTPIFILVNDYYIEILAIVWAFCMSIILGSYILCY